MKVLYLPGLYPTPENKESGIFIHKRLLTLKNEYKIDFDAVIPYTFNSGIMGKIKKKSKKYPEYFEIDGIRYNFLKVKYGLSHKFLGNYDELVLKALEKQLELKSYDLIHVHWTYPMGYYAYLLNKKYGIPYVLTAHGSDINYYKDRMELHEKIELSLNNAAKVIFVSRDLAENARKFNYTSKNDAVIHNGVDLELFKEMDRIKIKNELNLKKKVIGFVGNINEVKRADKFSEIFHIINNKLSGTHFLIVGDGPLKEQLKNDCSDLDILFTGRLPQQKIPYYMNAMDIMILPSRNEGFGCVAAEANACGVPVVGSSNGGIPEAIGNNNLIVNESESFENDFADKVIGILSEGYSPEKYKKRAQDFDWKNTVKQELDIYKEIIGETNEQR